MKFLNFFDDRRTFQIFKWFTITDAVITTIVYIIGLTTHNDTLENAPVTGLTLCICCWVLMNMLRDLRRDFCSQKDETSK